MSFPEWSNGQQNPEVPVNEGFDILKYAAVYGRDPETTAGLTWGWIGTSNESPTPTLDAYYWSGFLVTEGTQTLSNNATTYMTVARSTGVPNFSTSSANWEDSTNYARVFKLVTSGGQVVQIEDHRAGDRGIFGSSGGSGGGGGASATQTKEFMSGFIATPSDKDYRIVVKAAHGGTITETTTRSASGTCTATFKINTTALGGTANSVSSSEQSQAHSSSNVFAEGDDLVITISSNSSCADMSFTIKYTRVYE